MGLADRMLTRALPGLGTGLGNSLPPPRTPKGGAPVAGTQPVTWTSSDQPQMPQWNGQMAIESGFYQSVWVMRGLQTIADTIASLPFRAGPDPDNPASTTPGAQLASLLGPAVPDEPGGPTPLASSRAWWAWQIVQKLATGKMCAEIQTDKQSGRIVGLWPLVSYLLNPVPEFGTTRYFREFRYQLPTGETRMTPEQVFYAWKMSARDPRQPESVLEAAGLPISISIAIERHMWQLLKNRLVAPHIVATLPIDDPGQRRAWEEKFVSEFTGFDNAGKPIFAYGEPDPGGKVSDSVSVQGVATTPQDAMILGNGGLADWAKNETLVAVGVPESLIGNASQRIYANSDAEYRNFWTTRVLGVVSELQDDINNQLAPMIGDGQVGWFDLSRVVALQPPSAFAPPLLTDMLTAGVISVADAQRLLGVNQTGYVDVETAPMGEEAVNATSQGTGGSKSMELESRTVRVAGQDMPLPDGWQMRRTPANTTTMTAGTAWQWTVQPGPYRQRGPVIVDTRTRALTTAGDVLDRVAAVHARRALPAYKPDLDDGFDRWAANNDTWLAEQRYDVGPIGLGKNWVTSVGGLPPFVRAVAHALIRNGHPESEAIQLAIGTIKRWAAGGGKVTPKTRAKAVATVASWEAKKLAAGGGRTPRPFEQRVGPKGYIHGWIFVGGADVGTKVTHPTYGHGTVVAADNSTAEVHFDEANAQTAQFGSVSFPREDANRTGPAQLNKTDLPAPRPEKVKSYATTTSTSTLRHYLKQNISDQDRADIQAAVDKKTAHITTDHTPAKPKPKSTHVAPRPEPAKPEEPKPSTVPAAKAPPPAPKPPQQYKPGERAPIQAWQIDDAKGHDAKDREAANALGAKLTSKVYSSEMFNAGVTNKGLSLSQVDALDSYTSTGYEYVNEYLRGTSSADPGTKHEAKTITSVVTHSTIKQPVTLFRGLADSGKLSLLNLKPGDTYTDKGVISTSLRHSVAAKTFSGKGGVVTEISVPAGTPGLYVAGDESEVILPPATQFQVDSVEGNTYKLSVVPSTAGSRSANMDGSASDVSHPSRFVWQPEDIIITSRAGDEPSEVDEEDGKREDMGGPVVTEASSAGDLLPKAGKPILVPPREAKLIGSPPHRFVTDLNHPGRCVKCGRRPLAKVHKLPKTGIRHRGPGHDPVSTGHVKNNPARARTLARKQHSASLDLLEQPTADRFRKLFDDQKTSVLSRLGGKRGRQMITRAASSADPPSSAAGSTGTTGAASSATGAAGPGAIAEAGGTGVVVNVGAVFDPGYWTDRTATDLNTGYQEAAGHALGQARHQLGIPADNSDSLASAQVAAALRGRAQTVASQITQTTRNDIASTLSEGVNAGEGIPQLSDRVRGVFDDAGRTRATMIARTETNSAVNAANDVYANSLPVGMVAGREWLAVHDTRTRTDHRIADGQRQPVGIPFRVGGYALMHPGDPAAPPSETINCRCTTVLLPMSKSHLLIQQPSTAA